MFNTSIMFIPQQINSLYCKQLEVFIVDMLSMFLFVLF